MRWKYSNLALALAGEVVSTLTGESWPDYIRGHILEPLGMTATLATTPAADHPRLAVGYARCLPGQPRARAPWSDLKAIAAAGCSGSTRTGSRAGGSGSPSTASRARPTSVTADRCVATGRISGCRWPTRSRSSRSRTSTTATPPSTTRRSSTGSRRRSARPSRRLRPCSHAGAGAARARRRAHLPRGDHQRLWHSGELVVFETAPSGRVTRMRLGETYADPVEGW